MVSWKVFFDIDNVKACLQVDGNDPVKKEKLKMQEKREIITRPNAWGGERMGCRVQVKEVPFKQGFV